MFRTVSPSIIRSLRLYIQHQVLCHTVSVAACWQAIAGTEDPLLQKVWHEGEHRAGR